MVEEPFFARSVKKKNRVLFNTYNIKYNINNTEINLNFKNMVNENVKIVGLGFSVGKEIGISTPFGGVSVDLEESCIIQ